MNSLLLSEKQLATACSVCDADLKPSAFGSELVRGPVCIQCHEVEQNGWKTFGIGSLVILLLWLTFLILHRCGFVSGTISGLFSPAWTLVWFLVCIWMVSRRLKRRQKTQS